MESDENPDPKYNFIDGDQVWMVLDIDMDKDDSREPQIENIKLKCKERVNWFLTLSNPCFEVWLYYHAYSRKPLIHKSDNCSTWKKLVNRLFKGGFDSRKHPVYMERASINAKKNFSEIDEKPDIGCIEVYNLANAILPLIKEKLEKVLIQIEE